MNPNSARRFGKPVGKTPTRPAMSMPGRESPQTEAASGVVGSSTPRPSNPGRGRLIKQPINIGGPGEGVPSVPGARNPVSRKPVVRRPRVTPH
jgi:hypothetical protein